ncbi:MAG TPA: ATP-binding protein [Polyangia bacterium]|nr:ATP-binding protein [Polyangia bacterium]
MPRSRALLLVDDNQTLTDNLREILEEAGYVVRTAASCAQALETARAGFKVALVDVRLPDGDGIELAARLREVIPDAQVILLTGFATVESAASAVRAGAWAYLMKPCATPELLLTVEQAMRHVRALEERREAAGRAQVAEKLAAVGTLTAGLSHEIRNPLNAAALQLTVLERRLKKLPADAQPPLVEPLELVQSEIQRLNAILEDFLQFARPRQLVLASVELPPLLDRVLDLLSAQAERVQVRLERSFAGAPPVAGDAGRLQQAVMNLALNAIQATPPGGFVRVEARASADGREVELAIEDSGAGIPEPLRRRVFEPFFTTKPAGSGLGLPLVHSIIEQHGGSIVIEDGAAGGARFVLRLRPSA